MNRNLPFSFYASYFLKGWKTIFLHQRPIFVTFFVTSRCNARCQHCFYWRRINNTGNELTIDEIKKNSSSMLSFPKLLLSGGEPFLREDIDEICKIFCSNNNIKQIPLPTNGILSDKIYEKIKIILRFCQNSHIQIQLSIDGLGKIHDRIRRVPEAFDRLMRTYYLLRDLKKQYKF